jgi:pre-mRNA-splicing factor 38B
MIGTYRNSKNQHHQTMSRAALWRQEGNVKEREREAEEAYNDVLEAGRQHLRTSLPLWGPDDGTFHLHPVLLRHTIHASYFYNRCCRELLNWNAVIDEIYNEVKTMDTFSSSNSKQPSTAFCLLLRLLTLRMTDHQMTLTLAHADSPYIRAIGFVYLRYVCPPERLLSYIEPYFFIDDEDGQEVKIDRSTISLGQFVRSLFTQRDYFGATPLPRLPGPVEVLLRDKIRAAERAAERAKVHYKNADRMRRWTTTNASAIEVMALYGDDDHPLTWYRAIIDRVVRNDDESSTTGGRPYLYPRFVVTFPDYGNTETVRLGELDELHHRRHGQLEREEEERRSGNSSSNRDHHNGQNNRRLESSSARGGEHHPGGSRHPQQHRGHSHHHQYHQQQQQHDRPVPSHRPHPARKDFSPPHGRYETTTRTRPTSTSTTTTTTTAAQPAAADTKKRPLQQQRTPAELAAIAEKRRKLAAKYG